MGNPITTPELSDAVQAATAAATDAARAVLEARGLVLDGVLVVAEVPGVGSTGAVDTASWMTVNEKASLPVVVETLRRVIERLDAQQVPVPPEPSEPQDGLN